MLHHQTKETIDDEPLTPRADNSLGSLLDTFQNLYIDQEPENNPLPTSTEQTTWLKLPQL